MCNSGFLRGMLAGVAVGTVVGMTAAQKKKSMKTCVGRTMQHMGCAVDSALDDLMHR